MTEQTPQEQTGTEVVQAAVRTAILLWFLAWIWQKWQTRREAKRFSLEAREEKKLDLMDKDR